MVCPVCQKAGINSEAIICPQCNSDLSQLHLLTRIESKLANWRKRNSILVIVLGTVITTLFILLLKPKTGNTTIGNSQKIARETIDSTEYYRNKYFVISHKIDSLNNVAGARAFINYKVKFGDNLSKIALMFYNDASKITKIAKDNGLKNANQIFVNQSLVIEIDK